MIRFLLKKLKWNKMYFVSVSFEGDDFYNIVVVIVTLPQAQKIRLKIPFDDYLCVNNDEQLIDNVEYLISECLDALLMCKDRRMITKGQIHIALYDIALYCLRTNLFNGKKTVEEISEEITRKMTKLKKWKSVP